MRSIICNCCWGGFLYRRANKQFDNPFFWSRVYTRNFIKLLEHFDEIDFDNIDMGVCDNYIVYDPVGIRLKDPKIILTDFDIHIAYHHYHYSATDVIPRKVGVNVYYHKNYILCYDKFVERVSRMSTMENPIYVYVDNEQPGFSTQQDKLDLIQSANIHRRPLVFYTEDPAYSKYNSDFVTVICDSILPWDHMTEKYYHLFA